MWFVKRVVIWSMQVYYEWQLVDLSQEHLESLQITFDRSYFLSLPLE